MDRLLMTSLVLHLVVGDVESSLLSPLVKSPAGKFTGYQMTSSHGRKFWAYSGIRYAKPPIGPLRFKAPVPAPPLIKKYAAVLEGPECLQMANGNVAGSEDCLFINVYTLDTTRRVPVMVWIHGGGYEGGTGSKQTFGPELLMNEDVVVVTLQYRLQVLGFGSFGNDVMPGNFGLKDQEEAIRWVKRNIASFGGDKNAITIFGQSAGAGSVSLLLRGRIAPLVRGGIAMSGSALCPWTIGRTTRNATLQLAAIVGCENSSDEETLACLLTKSGADLIQARMKINLVQVGALPFVPVVEPNGPVPADPWLLEPSDRPLLIGHTTAESNFIIGLIPPAMETLFYHELNKNLDGAIAKTLSYEYTAKDPEMVGEEIKKFYFPSGMVNAKNNRSLQEVTSDGAFNYPIYKDVLRARGPVYFYVFDYLSAGQPNYGGQGPAHDQDSPFIWRKPQQFDVLSNGTDEDRKKSEEYVKIFTNFAKGLEPTPSKVEGSAWDRNSAKGGYLYISSEISRISDTTWEPNRMKFWSGLPFRPDNK